MRLENFYATNPQIIIFFETQKICEFVANFF